MKRMFLGAAMGLSALAALPVLAHHSMGGFDRNKTIAVTGTVKEFKWANPHSWIELDVPDGKGGTVDWNVEMTAPAQLIRAGWKSNVIETGRQGHGDVPSAGERGAGWDFRFCDAAGWAGAHGSARRSAG